MIDQWLLVLMLYSPPHGFSHSHMLVISESECISLGEQWVNKMTDIRNIDNKWKRWVRIKAKYKCLNWSVGTKY